MTNILSFAALPLIGGGYQSSPFVVGIFAHV
jgi:hypothetical protein